MKALLLAALVVAVLIAIGSIFPGILADQFGYHAPHDHDHTPAPIPKANLTVTFLDVGQGDSAWIVSPYGKTMLIDAGSDGAAPLVAIGKERENITFVVATHPHEDHIGGMAAVLKNYEVRTFIDSG